MTLRAGISASPETGSVRAAAGPTVFDRAIRALAAHDWLLVGYLVVLLLAVLWGGGPRRTEATLGLLAVLLSFVCVLALTRGNVIAHAASSASLYRASMLVPLLGSFFQLHFILPAASGPCVDDALYALDLRVFGVEPSVAWDRFVTPVTTEWFAFFYYGYFFLLGVHVFPMLFFGRDSKVLGSFGFGFMWVYCVGQVIYTVVPAHGPYAALASHFQHRLEGNLFWPLVKSAVDSVDGGARTDVFPSLHTGGPTFISIFSWRNRKTLPFRYTWIPVSLFTTQIILATMFLRWHYLVDIVAGIVLAALGCVVGEVAVGWDRARVRAGGPATWPGPTGEGGASYRWRARAEAPGPSPSRMYEGGTRS